MTGVEFLGSSKKRKTFKEGASLPLEMEGLSATSIRDVIYVSGTTKWGQVSTVLSFSTHDKTWNKLGTLKTPRHSPIGKI